MKKKRTRWLSLLVSAALLLTSLPMAASAAQFSDVSSGAWYYTAVTTLADQGIVSGTGGGRYSPSSPLTRGAFVTMLAKSVLTSGEVQQYQFQGGFKDVKTSHWANPYVNWAVETGVASGYEDDTFRPDNSVSRQEMAVMVRNFAQSTGRKFPSSNSSVTFKDQGQIASWALSAVQLCQRAGVINGDEDTGKFRPADSASRAEAASICYNFLNKCQTNGYSIVQKRVKNVAVRAVSFTISDYTPGLVMAQDMVDGRESSTSLVSRTGATIAVNGAFFNMDNYTPLGTLISDGRILTLDNMYAPEKAALVVSPSGSISVESFSTFVTATLTDTEGQELSTVENVVVNKWPSSSTDAARIVATRDWGRQLNFPTRDAVVVDSSGTITAIYQNAANVDIPENGFVLCQRSRRQYEGNFFDSCKVGMTISLDTSYQYASGQELPFDPVMSMGAGPRIVKDGQVYGGYATYREEGFSDWVTSGNTVRVCVGVRKNGTMVIVEANTSVPKMAEIMVAFGCSDAVNLDGGGSTNLYVDGYWLYGPQSRLLNNMLYFTR